MAWLNTQSRGNKRTIYLNTVVTMNAPYTVSMIRSGDTFDNTAFKSYRNATRWWQLADANPQIFYPLDIAPGDQIRIPT